MIRSIREFEQAYLPRTYQRNVCSKCNKWFNRQNMQWDISGRWVTCPHCGHKWYEKRGGT